MNSKGQTLHLVVGNAMNRLADALGEELFSPSSRPFDKRLIVVPNAAFKDFLFRRFAAHPLLNMAAGVQVLPLNQAVMEILDSGVGINQKKKIPSFLELTLAIEEKLYCYPELLSDYLNVGNEKKSKRISALSDELARIFLLYGLYGRNFLPTWLVEKGWQQSLWSVIFSEQSPWTYPLQALEKENSVFFEGKIALFGFSYLSLAHLHFFGAFAPSIYQLSPCALFWEDLASDKERLSTGRFLQRKGLKENVRSEIEHYMEQSHPLLGNWGKLGREMLKSLDTFILDEKQLYCDGEGKTLLICLQRSILMLDEEEVLKVDDSIQLHSATSKLREVEILRDALETLVQRHAERGDPIRPRDIVVVSPDIASYAPYIQMVFADSPFSFAIEGLPLSSVSVGAQALLQLLKLPSERYELSSVEKLLRCPAFMEKWGFTFDELSRLSQWLKLAQVRRGLSGPSSWEEGLDRLLLGLCMEPDDALCFENWPLPCIPQSEIDLFNKFQKVFSELKEDLLTLGIKQRASDWMDLFLQMADKYFVLDWEKEAFFQEIKSLALSCRSLTSAIWDFESIFRILQHLFDKSTGRISSSRFEKITFVKSSQACISTARVLWCLGMNEGAFPRADSMSSLCEMRSSDYFLRKSDEDRSLMLEMLVKAQDYVIFSYQRLNADDAKHQGPSLLIEELDQYLKKRGIEGGMQKMDHPAFPLDPVYFSSDAQVKKWRTEDFLAAKAVQEPVLKKTAFFQSSLLAQKEIPCVIDIRQLKKLARNPLQFYFNETCKIFLNSEEDEEESEFIISNLRKAVLRKNALQRSLPQLLEKLKAQGRMPLGLFHAASVRDLEEEMRDLLNELDRFGVSADQIFSVRFMASCRESEKTAFLRPPLIVPLKQGRVAHITGVLEDISPRGLLAHAESDLKSLVKLWPQYLIFRCMDENNKLLLLTKKGKEVEIPIPDPKASLAEYIEYYLLAKESPSPLMPEWAKALLEGGLDQWKKAMEKEGDYGDPYLCYLKRRNGLSDAEEAISHWSDRLRCIFAPLLSGGADAL